MRKFNIGDNVKVERSGLHETVILDKKYFGIFTMYAVSIKYKMFRDEEKIEHLEWFSKGELCKSN